MSYIRIKADGKPEIDKKEAICHFLKELPKQNDSFIELFKKFDTAIKNKNSRVTSGGLNNTHGDWYEWLLAICAWNTFAQKKSRFLAVLLPNIKRFDVSSLYHKDIFNLIEDLRNKISAHTSVQLITSNPDFVIIDPEGIELPPSFYNTITNITPETIVHLEEAYQHFIGQCKFESIIGYSSVKTSLRPDRRLQIPHEGSLVKAIYTHIQTRKWILNPRGLKYYAIAQSYGDADIQALKTVATHSITTVNSIPEAAVDDLFSVNTFSEAAKIWTKILN